MDQIKYDLEELPVDPAAKGRVVISATNYNYPRTNTQTLMFQNSMPVSPLEKLHPMRVDSILRYTTLPKFKEPYPHKAGRIIM